jgi:hypothetical protein
LSRPTAPGRSPCRSWSGCGAATTLACGRRRCGGCCTRPPPAPARPCPSTSRTSSWTTSACRCAPRAATLDWLHFQTGSARLLPRLIAGRPRGPLFHTDRAPVPARVPAAVDRCPDSGRARLSYRRAEALFRQASGGWTLHQLRHSALTHLAQQNVSLPLLLAKSRHASLRSLQRYARPGPEAVARSPWPPTPPAGAADYPPRRDQPRRRERRCGWWSRGIEPLASCMPCHPRPRTTPSPIPPGTTSPLAGGGLRRGGVGRGEAT